MATKIIDQFKVKRKIILGIVQQAEIQILINDAGLISTNQISGVFTINDPLTSYYKEYRNFDSGQVITRFCDFVTHKETVVTAIDTYPYAAVTFNNDVLACGYLVPVPKPADPPNPYGTVIYRPYKYTEFCDHFGNNIRVDINRKLNYQNPQTNLEVDYFYREDIPGALFYAKVYVDRNTHLVSYTGPMQTTQSTNRTYAPNDLITEVCDYATGTNLKVYAQAAPPFAYIVEETDAPSCAITDGPDPEYIENWGSPVIMDYKTDGDDKNPKFAVCEVTLNLLSGPNFTLQEFYTQDEREFQVIITDTTNNIVKFKGMLIPDSCQEPFVRAPYEVSIKATDGIGGLKSVTYSLPVSRDLKTMQRFIDVIAFALAPTNLDLNIRTVCNVYETKMLNGLDDDPLAQASINPLKFAGDNGNMRSCYEVLEEICKLFKACLYQANGEWVFERRSELSSEKARSRVYNNKALFLYAEQIDSIRTMGNFDHTDIQIFDPQPDLYRGNAYKRVEVLAKFGHVPSVVFNGGFDLWDGQNFSYWTKFNGIKVDRILKTIPNGVFSEIPINDYAMKFLERANTSLFGKWIQTTPMTVFKGDSLRLSFTNSPPVTPMQSLKIRVKVNDYYLTNDATTGELVWVKAIATLIIPIRGTYISLLQSGRGKVNMTFPDAPESGSMVIQFFGPQDYTKTTNASGAVVYVENANYYPLDIDNVAVSKQSKVDDKLAEGIMHLAEQGGYFTSKPEVTEILFSDYQPTFELIIDISGVFNIQNYNFANPELVVGGTNPLKQETIVIDDLYAILTADGSYSTTWYEFGNSSGRVPIGLLLAKSILKDYQRPFWYATGNYLGESLSYANALRFDLACEESFSQKVFNVLSCTLDLKTCTMTNVNMCEMFDRYVKSTNISNPSYPGDVSPPFANDPNSPPLTPTNGIFTDEFTSEFF